MGYNNDFVDYYEVLQVSPNCDARIIESAYRNLAKHYHPDHPETADSTRFHYVIQAHNTLKDSNKRSEYDLLYKSQKIDNFSTDEQGIKKEVEEEFAIYDAGLQKEILFLLYKRRRDNAKEPGINAFFLQDLFKCSDDYFEFHIWYLKSKGFINLSEQGTLAITVVGVDHVISMHQHKRSEKLLIAHSSVSED